MSSEMLQTIAWGVVTGATGILRKGRNVEVSRVAAGNYTLTLGDNFLVDSDEMLLTITPRNVSPFYATQTTQGASDQVKVIETYNSGGVRTDTDFSFKIEKLNIL